MGIWVSLLLAIYAWGAEAFASGVQWTPAESSWMARHPVVRVGVNTGLEPMEFVDARGQHVGISADLRRFLERETGLRLEPETRYPWKEVLYRLQTGELDISLAMRDTPGRRAYLIFTAPFMRVPMVIVTHEEAPYIDALEELRGKVLAIVPGMATTEFLVADSITTLYREYPDYREALRGVAEGEAYAVLVSLVVATYEIRSGDLPLRVAAPTRYESEYVIGVRKDWPELHAILDKALAGLTPEQKYALKNDWVNAQVHFGVAWHDVAWLLLGIGTLFLLAMLTIGRWNRRLLHEVEQRKQAQAEASAAAAKMSLLFDHMDQGFAVFELLYDSQGKAVDYRYLEVNPAFKRLFASLGDEWVGRTRSSVACVIDEEWLEQAAQVAKTGNPCTLERTSPVLGRWLRYELFCPSPGQFAATITDISDQKKYLAALQAQMEEMTHLLYTVAHDLNGPNLTIGSFSQLLEEELKDQASADVKEYLHFVLTASRRMSTLLSGLQSVAKVGPRNLDLKPCALRDIAEEAGQLLGGLYMKRGIALELNLPKGLVAVVDRERLLQVFQNLMENVAKYMGKEENPQVRVECLEEGGRVAISVRDNGMGIAEDRLKVIFDIFSKVDKGSEGAGIGLALVKRIVEAHGGRIWAESEGLGRGSAFCFTLGDRFE